MVCSNPFVMTWDPLERFLWGSALTIALMCAIYFIRIAKKREAFNERIMMLGLASLPLGFASSLFFTFIQVLLVPGNIISNTFCGNYESVVGLEIYDLFGVLSYISFGLGGTLFVLAFDIVVKRTRFILTLISTVVIGLEIIFAFPNPDLARDIFNILLVPALIFLVPFVLFLYTKWSHLEFKAVSSFFLFGFILFMISLNFAKSTHKELNFFPLFLGPLFLIAGCCIMIIPIFIDPNMVSRPLTYWVLFAILTITILIGITIFDFVEVTRQGMWSLRWILLFGEFVVAIIYCSILLSLIIRNIRSELISISEEKLKEDEIYKANFLSMFTRPQHVNFLASISHELKTPLTSIIGFAGAILKGRAGVINEEQEKQLKIILNSANHLNELITDVIDMTKIEANKFNVKKQSFDLISELQDVVETFNLIIKKKGLELYMDTPQKCIVYNDKKRINQILINLIGNAVKFTEKGKISIKLRFSKGEIIISVKDTGPGIKTEDLKKLFVPFSRIIEPGKVKEGVGLGLHLSKKLANLLGGDIVVKSKYGKGSTFKLVLKID